MSRFRVIGDCRLYLVAVFSFQLSALDDPERIADTAVGKDMSLRGSASLTGEHSRYYA